MELLLLLLFLPAAASGKHSLTYVITTTSGLQAFPEFLLVGLVDGVEVGYCDSVVKTAEARQDWVKKMNADNPQNQQMRTQNCLLHYNLSKADISSMNQHFNQTDGLHVLQERASCEWDTDTGNVTGSQQFVYDGEDFIKLDLQNRTWVFADRASTYKQKWDTNNTRLNTNYKLLTEVCPQWLKLFYSYGNRSLERTVPPSVSLLRQSPSSPVSCHATGFYPDRAQMFWRKDGEEIHEDVDQGEILPNQDGTFQMSVELQISSVLALLVLPEAWRNFECVFQSDGAAGSTVTRLDQAAIRTNWAPPSKFPAGGIAGIVVALLLLTFCITFCLVWRWNRSGSTNIQMWSSDTFAQSSTTDLTPPREDQKRW